MVMRRELIVWWRATKQYSLGLNVTMNYSLRNFMPADIEGAEFWEKLKLAIRKMVMNPIGHGTPIGSCVVLCEEPWNHDAGHCTMFPVFIWKIPYMGRCVTFVRSAVVALFIPERIDGWRSIR